HLLGGGAVGRRDRRLSSGTGAKSKACLYRRAARRSGTAAGRATTKMKRNWVAVARPDRSLEYGRGTSSRYHIARRNGHERLPQLLFGPRLGLFHRLHAPVLRRLR